MAIKDELSNILSFMSQYQTQIQFNKEVLDIYEGAILKYIEELMVNELNAKAFERSKNRIPPINLLTRVVEKVSKIYKEAPSRSVSNPVQQEILDYYTSELNVDNCLGLLNSMLNLHKYAALELYYDKSNKLRIRVVPADRFFVYSNDVINPDTPTHFIKFVAPVTVANGSITQRQTVLHIFSADEFAIVQNGNIVETRENPFGVIPFVYANLSPFDLIPKQSDETKRMPVLVPMLLADINYASKYLSHSIMYGVDVNIDNLDANPDAFWSVKSDEGEGKNPQISTISPTVDVDKTLALINAQVSMWLESRGLKTSSNGTLSTDNAASGVAKMIDESSTTEIRQEQTTLFRNIEKELWEKVAALHNYEVPVGMISATSEFTPSVVFADQKPFVDPKQELELIIAKKDNGLISHRRAMIEANPHLSSDEIDLEMAELTEPISIQMDEIGEEDGI